MSAIQISSDLRTGRATGINDEKSSSLIRLACDYLNDIRAYKIFCLISGTPIHATDHPESIYVDLKKLGLSIDTDGIIKSEILELLPGGQESTPYRDNELKIIYKLFPITSEGNCGRSILLDFDSRDDGKIEISVKSGSLEECLDKLSILNKAGAHPTEIVGLTECHRYFVVKQPLAKRIPSNDAQRNKAMKFVGAITEGVSRFNRLAVVTWVAGHPWLFTDLTWENIMLDSNKQPTIIDALVYKLSTADRRYPLWLMEKIHDAQDLREGRRPPHRALIDEGVDDDSL